MSEQPRGVFSSSPWRHVDIPDVSLPTYVLAGAAKRGDRPALIDGPSGRTLTYAALAKHVRSAGRWVGRARLPQRRHATGPVPARTCRSSPLRSRAGDARRRGHHRQPAAHRPRTGRAARRRACQGARHQAPQLLDKAREAADQVAGVRDVPVFGDADGATPFAQLLETGDEPPEVDINPTEDVVALPVLEWHDGALEGRDAHASQPGCQLSPD